jgi:succinate dehydrogenase flavin-adding protein (antitoxin of CptAB toxin-antitoxin module)
MMDTLQKKAVYLACHRGTKEADLLIGSFVEEYLQDNLTTLETTQTLCQWLNQDDDMILHPSADGLVFAPFPALFHQWLQTKL